MTSTKFMPTAPPPSRDVALDTRVFWERFKKEITAALIIVLIAIVIMAILLIMGDDLRMWIVTTIQGLFAGRR